MAVAKVFKNGGSLVFVVKRNIREKYGLKEGDRVDYLLKGVKGKDEMINELVEGVKARNIAGSIVLHIPVEVCQIYNIEVGDYILYDVMR